jgi:hypothetical protein
MTAERENSRRPIRSVRSFSGFNPPGVDTGKKGTCRSGLRTSSSHRRRDGGWRDWKAGVTVEVTVQSRLRRIRP